MWRSTEKSCRHFEETHTSIFTVEKKAQKLLAYSLLAICSLLKTCFAFLSTLNMEAVPAFGVTSHKAVNFVFSSMGKSCLTDISL
jgi:hypothetical protein